MPYTEVMSKYKRGTLHSGSDKGPVVKSRPQAIAIMLSEKREAMKGKKEYQAPKGYAKGGCVEPSTEEVFKDNLINTVANPTGRKGFKKGGPVARDESKGYGWRRWGHKGGEHG